MSTNKSFSTETSERYSRALFEVSKDAGELEKVEQDLKKLQFLLNESLEVKNFIHNPTQSKENQNNAINLLAQKLIFSKILKNFMFLLIEKRRILFIEKIIDSFLKLCSKKRGEVEASLISSKELSDNEIESISKDLSSSMGSTIKFNYKVDKELIGGLKLQLGSFMIDTSIKNKLNKLEQKMLES
tara:strand:- start:454 stop:1011 length:558 start_codon:yes stop_codon:yes gene_type:complete